MARAKYTASAVGVAAAASLCLLAMPHAAWGDIAADRITRLPGWPAGQPLSSAMWSGFLNVDASAGRYLHYWFAESEGDPSKDPLIVWFNGGPGCSSMDGMLQEMGPVHVNTTDPTQLYHNPYAWTRVASMLFIEAPAGVGWSYSETKADYAVNDTRTAADNLAALLAFYAGFPEYAASELYIMGESYAGVYVPQTADAVRRHNIAVRAAAKTSAASSSQSPSPAATESTSASSESTTTAAASIAAAAAAAAPEINLVGIAVGNGCTGSDIGVCSQWGLGYHVDYWAAHALISPRAHAAAVDACGASFLPPFSAGCEAALAEARAWMGDVDIYWIYGPCLKGPHPGIATATAASAATAAAGAGGAGVTAAHVTDADGTTAAAAAAGTAAGAAAGSGSSMEHAMDASWGRKMTTAGYAHLHLALERGNRHATMSAAGDGDGDGAGAGGAGVGDDPGPAVCIDSGAMHAWLNSPAVIDALHVKPAIAAGIDTWYMCTNRINYTRTVANEPRDTYPLLVGPQHATGRDGYRVLIYNGDADACVPWTDNDAWTSGMGWAPALDANGTAMAWRAWAVDGQVAGYSTTYDVGGAGNGAFTFATVKGAGHMVPQVKPAASLAMVTRFLANQTL